MSKEERNEEHKEGLHKSAGTDRRSEALRVAEGLKTGFAGGEQGVRESGGS
jgi:hypothetical protein